MLYILIHMSSAFEAKPHRLDHHEAIVGSGVFEECAAAIEAFAAGGAEQVHHVGNYNLVAAMRIVLNCHSHPGCEARIRSLAAALEFCLQHDVGHVPEIGASTATIAAQIGEPVSTTARHVVHPLTDRSIR